MTGTEHNSGRGDRIAGALLGVHAGDALGATLEFTPWAKIRARHPAATGVIPLDDEAAGFVLDSLSLAVCAVLDPRPLPDVLIDIVRIGNDTDTNSAIAGGLLGARDGASAIPKSWRQALQFAAEFTEAATALATPNPGVWPR